MSSVAAPLISLALLEEAIALSSGHACPWPRSAPYVDPHILRLQSVLDDDRADRSMIERANQHTMRVIAAAYQPGREAHE